jgi:hypothetical protein
VSVNILFGYCSSASSGISFDLFKRVFIYLGWALGGRLRFWVPLSHGEVFSATSENSNLIAIWIIACPNLDKALGVKKREASLRSGSTFFCNSHWPTGCWDPLGQWFLFPQSHTSGAFLSFLRHPLCSKEYQLAFEQTYLGLMGSSPQLGQTWWQRTR